MFELVAIDPQFDLRELCNFAVFWAVASIRSAWRKKLGVENEQKTD